MNNFVPEELRSCAATYEERHKTYGDSYKTHGPALMVFFPDGVELKTEADHNRFGVLTQMFTKLNRYCANFSKGGHEDSLHDLITYTAMLQELDGEVRE